VNAIGLTAAALALVWTMGATVAVAQHWGYSGEAGPENWSKIDPKFAMCALGRNQSPVDLAGFVRADLRPLKIEYRAGAAEILHTGHTVQVNYAAGSRLTVEGRAFELKQFHFHAPSENRIGGKQFPLEAHLVHADGDGNLAVIAVMFQEGAANPFLATLWEKMPKAAGDKSPLSAGLNVSEMLATRRDYYRFNGSLTTPPCSEGVRWIVMKKTVSASRAQIEDLSKALGFANNRPVQPVNARVLLR
jgi:carbonic anhydrase